MDQASAAVGSEKTCTRYMYLGPDAHVLTFPVAQGAFLNVVAFVTDAKAWPHDKLTATTTKTEVVQCFARFGPTVRKLMALVPDTLNQWAVFDTLDHPAHTYVKDRLVLLGDAAHASSPHHGAGAGCGIEDAAALSTLLAAAVRDIQADSRHDKTAYLHAALEIYDTIRRERASWVVESSRFVGELYEWQTNAGSDTDKCEREAYDRCHKIWDYDVNAMVQTVQDLYETRIHH
jgi:salicylate hydroxylase